MEEKQSWFWEGRPWEAFKSFAIIFSFVVNFVLIIVLLLVMPIILPIVNDVAEPIVGGLNDSFIMMGDATISQTISVDTTMPLSLTIPLSTTTNVRVIEDVPLNVAATFLLPGGGGIINGTVVLALPAGTELPVALNLDVAVDQTVPVVIEVPVEIPLDQTELGVPFNKLKDLFAPLDELVKNLPSNNEEFVNRTMESTMPR
jgi:hypothetical protein